MSDQDQVEQVGSAETADSAGATVNAVPVESGTGSLVVNPSPPTTHATQPDPLPQRTIAGRNGGTLHPFTSASALAARQARSDKAENVVRRALREKAGGSSWAAGVLAIAEAQYDIATSGQRGSTPAAVFVMRAAGLMGDRRDQASAPPGGAVVVLSESAVAGLAAALADHLSKE